MFDESATESDFDRLWQEYQAQPLPPGCSDTRIEGISLEELDLELADCIRTAIERRSLGHNRRIVLMVSLDKLSRVIPRLGDEARDYFARLKQLALVLIERFA